MSERVERVRRVLFGSCSARGGFVSRPPKEAESSAASERRAAHSKSWPKEGE